MNEFVKPAVEYFELLPLLVVAGAALVGVLIEAFAPRSLRYTAQSVLTTGALLVALACTVMVATDLTPHLAEGATSASAYGLFAVMGALAIDGPTVFLWGLILIIAVLGSLLFSEKHLEGGLSAFAGQAAAPVGSEAEREASARGLEHTEIYPLLLFAVFGMLLFPASNDVLTMFVALEVMSLPLYLLCGLARRRRLLSQEAALKYFLLGAFSSAFFLFGAALIYGFAGSMEFARINEAVKGEVANGPMLLVGMGMLAVGLLFKVGAAPFQAWTPDVYQGAPTPVTAFMSAATKIAAFGALMRLFYVAFGADRGTWVPVLSVIAVASMLIGAVMALTQRDMKRLLAYSSIAHTGFILTGFLGVQSASSMSPGQITSVQAVLFYLVTYGLAVLGAFAVVGLVRDANGEANDLSRWAGIGKQSPVVAGVFAFFLLAMAGIPLTSGFIGKWAVFSVALDAGNWPVVVAAIIASVIAVYLYVKVIVVMFFVDPDHEAEAGPTAVAHPSVLSATAIGLGAAATLALGVLPGPVLDLAARAGEFIR